MDSLLRPRFEKLESRVMLAGPQEAEPNDVIDDATPLMLAEDPAGRGLLAAYGQGTIDPATANNTWSDPDYWSFSALAGDVVSITVATPSSLADTYVELRNSAELVLRSDANSGAETDAYISHYTIGTSGNYFVRVGKASASTVAGDYQLRVDVARGINLESDAEYANDDVNGADLVVLSQGSPGEAAGAVGGVMMAPQESNLDEDYYSLGTLDPGNTVSLNAVLPAISSVDPRVKLVDSSGTNVSDTDANPNDADFSGMIAAAGEYYAVVEANSGAGPLATYLLDINLSLIHI